MAGKSSKQGSINSKADRRQAVADMQAQARSRARRRTVALWGSITAVVVAIALAVTVVVTREQGNQPDLSGVSTFPVKQGHVDTPVTYAQSPPAGGEHSPVWLNCGAYTAPKDTIRWRAMRRRTLPSNHVAPEPTPCRVALSTWSARLPGDQSRFSKSLKREL